ncbi:MAG: flagellar FlbD family protein [Actinomycetota bacterium]
MITLHRLNGDELVLNAELIEAIEATPDTLVTLVDRRRIMVLEPVDEVVEAVVAYRRRLLGTPLVPPAAHVSALD